MKLPDVVYIRWRDASYTVDDTRHEDLGLAELHEVGWLIRETPEAVSVGVEWQDGNTESRLTLTVPRINILEIKRLKWRRRSACTPAPL